MRRYPWLINQLAGPILLCISAGPFAATAAETPADRAPMVWSFAEGFQGWQAQNWETIDIGPRGINGKTAYDCQLLSPVLNIRAKDYEVLAVCLRSDTTGRGEIFLSSPGEGMSDQRKIPHTLGGSATFSIRRTELRDNPHWRGTIERLRYDALNTAGATIAIQFIALLPNANSLLINGDAEMLVDGAPFSWHPVSYGESHPGITDEDAMSGKRALRLPGGTGWETDLIDLSFLNEMSVTGAMRGTEGELSIRAIFSAGDETVIPSATTVRQATGQQWQPFEFAFSPPDMAASVVIRFECTRPGSTLDIDAIQCERGTRRPIVEMSVPGPAWSAAWIWHEQALDQDDCTIFVRKQFMLAGPALRLAQLQITADDAYIAVLNGNEIGRTIGEQDGWRTPELIDIKELVKPGMNELFIEARDVSSAQGLLAEVVIVDAEGREQTIISGADWETAMHRDGPWVSAKALGRPPCQPWGYPPYKPMGELPTVALKVGRSAVRAERNTIAVDVSIDSQTPVRRPVYITALLKKGDEVLKRIPGPRAFFADTAPEARRDSLKNWSIPAPFGVEGSVVLSFDIQGAVTQKSLPEMEIQVVMQAKNEAFPTARVIVKNRVPMITVNGETIDPTEALFLRPDKLHQQNALSTGVSIWSVALDDMGFQEDGFDYSEVDRKLHAYLGANPDAWLIPTFTFDTRYQRWWLEQHPEARCRLEDGSDIIGDYHGGRRMVPSYGSSVWREAYAHALRMLIRHLKETPFAARIIGFHPASGISWEWFHWGSQSGELVDYSDAGREDFRRWLREKYGTDAALCRAWHRENLTFASADIPPENRRRKPENGIFYAPATQQDVLDYHRYQHDIVADTIRYFGRIVKEETGDRALYGTYYGYTMHLPETPGFCQGSGHFSLYRLLEAPEIDFLMAPVAYSWREVGGTAATMTVAESAALNGKLFWNQADLRSHWSEQTGHGRPPDLAGSIACMQREAARNLAHGTAIQWYDFSKGWTFGDARLTAEMGRLFKANSARNEGDPWPLSDYLAVIVDERQMGTFDPFRPPYGLGLIYHQREALERAGVPWKAYLFSDLMKHPELLEHRAFMFLNLFRLRSKERTFLEQNVLKGDRTVMFVGPVGMLDETGGSAQNTGKLLKAATTDGPTDLPLQATFLPSLPEPWTECSGQTYGVAHAFAPTVVPADGVGKVLATFAGKTPALVQLQYEDCRVVWSVAPKLPTPAIRGLAGLAGIPITCRTDDAVYAGHGVVGIHARGNGAREILVPGKGEVCELIGGARWQNTVNGVRIDLTHGETRIFLRK